MITNNWRVVINSAADGAWNMSVDEAILESTASFQQFPTLRLYAWEPYCLSLGHAQSFQDVNLTELMTRNWDIVRRPTGGRAILHADELTYSICASNIDAHVHGTVLESYKRLSKGLLAAIEHLGIAAQSQPIKNPSERHTTNPICFEVPSDYEITINGKKIIGSAQARKKKGILQHGSIPIYGDISRIVDVLNYKNDTDRDSARSKLLDRATTLKSSGFSNIEWKDVIESMIYGFEKELEIKFEMKNLSEFELARAKELYQEKYANNDWTYRI